MKTREWSRRDFLRAAGIGSAASALLPFIPLPAAAQAMSGIKRLVLLSHPNGTVLHRWRSNGTGAPLVSGAAIPQLVGPVLAPLDRHRAHLALVDGLDYESGALPRPGRSQGEQAGHHGIAIAWSGARLVDAPEGTAATESRWSMAPTIDQLLAAQSPTRIRSLVVSTSGTGRGSYNPTEGIASYSGPRAPVPPQDDPRVVFDQCFSAPVDGDLSAAMRRRASRRSILSSVKGELGRLRAELPSVDRDRLDVHLAGVDDLDRRIAATQVTAVCATPAQPGATVSTQVLERLRLHFDIIRAAFACDLTRVANVLQGSEGTSAYWLQPAELPVDPRTGDMHVASHETYLASDEGWRRTCVEIMSRLQRAMAEEFARLIDGLDDDTLAVWGLGMGWGGPHVNWSVPFVLASKNRKLRGNQYLRFGNYDLDIETAVPSNPWSGPTQRTPHNRLLTTIMHLMGRTDVTAVGDAGAGGQLGGRDLDNSPINELFGA